MSKENAKAFLVRLLGDRTLVERCKFTTASGRLRIAAELGLAHTTEEMQSVIHDGLRRARQTEGELNDSDLNAVSGGSVPVPPDVIALLPVSVEAGTTLRLE